MRNARQAAGTADAIVRVRGVRKEYVLADETVVALGGIDLDIGRGEICCIFGTSGSGKSTLLNQLAGLEKPTRGCVYIGGAPISAMNEDALARFRQRHLGFVFQPSKTSRFRSRSGACPRPPANGRHARCSQWWASSDAWTTFPVRCRAGSSSGWA